MLRSDISPATGRSSEDDLGRGSARPSLPTVLSFPGLNLAPPFVHLPGTENALWASLQRPRDKRLSAMSTPVAAARQLLATGCE